MTTHGLFLTMLVAVGIVVNKQNNMEPLEVKHNAWLPYLIQLIGPSLIVSAFQNASDLFSIAHTCHEIRLKGNRCIDKSIWSENSFCCLNGYLIFD